MIDLLTDPIGALVGILALVAAFFGWGKMQKRAGRKEGEERVSRRAQVAAEARKDKRDEVESDIYTGGADAARDSLRKDWGN